ncbi:MAG: peptidase M4 family protein, partial [Lysobacteraceae bacterium]
MTRIPRFHLLALATAALLAGTDAAAATATRTDLHAVDAGGIAQRNAALAKAAATDTVHARHERALGLDADSRLVLIARKSTMGVRNHRYRQTFRGIPVFGEGIVVSEDAAGNVRTLFGQKLDGLAAQIPAGKPRLAASRAVSIAKSAGLGNRV